MTPEKIEEIKTLLFTVVKAIVKKPEAVELFTTDQTDEEKGELTLINIKVAPEDIPVCIGAGGSTAEAIRKIATLYSKKLEYGRGLFVRVDAPRMPRNHFQFSEE